MTINEIKAKYTSAGDIIYRTALRFVLTKGTEEVKHLKPNRLDTIDSYILACAADIASAEDFVESVTRPKEEDSLWVVMCKDEDTDGFVFDSVWTTEQGAIDEIKRQRDEIIEVYGIDNCKMLADQDDMFHIEYDDWGHDISVTITMQKVGVNK